MGIQGIVDSLISPHGNWTGLTPGWLITVWLIHILSEQNHLMEPVQQWVERHLRILRRLTGQQVMVLDFTDDRLALCLRDLSDQARWQAIEEQLGMQLIRVYELPSEIIRLDATVGSVEHNPEGRSLFQVGKAKNGLYETQFKLMLAALDPLGLSLVVDVEAGNRADDPLYVPSYQRVKKIIQQKGLLIVGDSKMSALQTRATIVAGGDFYLTPLADQKDEPELLAQVLENWLEQGAAARPIFLPEDQPGDDKSPSLNKAVACGFEVTRSRQAVVEGSQIEWEERLLVIRSYSYQKSIVAGLHQRLEKAEAALNLLTPPRGRGKKQIEEEAVLLSAVAQIEKKYRVQGFFHYDYQQEVEERQVRAYQDKPARTERQVRYQLTITRNPEAIEAAEFAAGWRIYVTHADQEKLSLERAVDVYRGQIVEENVFRRLHGKMLSLTPLYVQREDHARGLIHLLTLAARLLALGDYLAREALAKRKERLAGVYAGNANRSTDRPTTERMFKAFEGIDLVIFSHSEQEVIFLTPLSPVHERILALLGLHNTLFADLQSA